MPNEYWTRIRENLKKFWKFNDELVRIGMFERPDSQCELCGHKPITYCNVLMNMRTYNRLILGNNCIVQYKKALEQLGSNNKILYLPQHQISADNINRQYQGTATIIDFPVSLNRIEQSLITPEALDHTQLNNIMAYLRAFSTTTKANELFDYALEIWLDKGYYNSEFVESGYKDIKEWAKAKAKEEIEDYWAGSSEVSYEEDEILDFDDCSSDGTGFDEVDWDSHDFE